MSETSRPSKRYEIADRTPSEILASGDLKIRPRHIYRPFSTSHSAVRQQSISQKRLSHAGTFGGKGELASGIHEPVDLSFSMIGNAIPTIAATLTTVS